MSRLLLAEAQKSLSQQTTEDIKDSKYQLQSVMELKMLLSK